MTVADTLQRLIDRRVVAVIRHDDVNAAEDIARSCVAGGLNAIEITLTTPGADQLIATLTADLPDAAIGAGTVLDESVARQVIDAGATYMVSPVTDPKVMAVGRQAGVLTVPGVLTPTEAEMAAQQGAPMVKLFPASVVGRSFVRAIASVLPHISVMATGGIAEADVGPWLEAGTSAIGIGSDLNRAYTTGGGPEVEALARRLTDAVHAVNA